MYASMGSIENKKAYYHKNMFGIGFVSSGIRGRIDIRSHHLVCEQQDDRKPDPKNPGKTQ